MATINAPTLANTEYSGEAPLAPAHGSIVLAAAPIATKVRLNRLFAGSKIYNCKMVNAALGASTTVSVGWEYADGSAGGGAAALIPATSTAAAAKTDSAVAPTVLTGDAYITATIAGAAATGQLDVMTEFEFKGQ
jgi:hypothetical protein